MDINFRISSAFIKKMSVQLICVAAILLSNQANAQTHTETHTSKFGMTTTTTTTTTTVNPALLKASQTPRALPYANFRKSDLYLNRQKLYRSTFNNPSKSVTMADGTNLQIRLEKNPSYVNQGNSITHNIYPGTNSPNVPVNYVIEEDQGWAYNNYYARVQATSVDFEVCDYSFQEARIYPGAIYTFDSYIDGRTWQTPSASTRNAITIATDNPNAQVNFVQINHPAANTVHNAIGTLVSHWGSTGNSITKYKFFESNNMADWTLKANAGGSFSGSELLNNGFFNTSDRRHHRYITIDVSKQLFSFFTSPPPNGFYSATNSAEGTPNLVVVGNVNYGVRLLITMELTFPNVAEADAFSDKFGYLSYTTTFDMNYLQSHSNLISRISAYEIGGAHAPTVSIDKNNIQSNINTILSGVNAMNAKPISYRLYSMGWDILGANANTGTFKYINANPHYVLSSAKVSVTCGEDGKNKETHYYYALLPSAGAAAATYSNTSENSKWGDHTSGHDNNLVVAPDNDLKKFINGINTLRMAIAKPASDPFVLHPTGFFDPFAQLVNYANAMKMMVSSFSKDDIHPFKLTLTLGFTKPGATNQSYYTITWNNLSASTKTKPILELHFKYSNGHFIAQ